jgi:hypothetical protein
MSRLISSYLIAGILMFGGDTFALGGDHEDITAHWFYMVKSRPSDPARDAEFNAWYNGIDIPDVLAVPGFLRARRAVKESVPGISFVPSKHDDGNYVALYDIETADIDKSIIDLYVAARKMVYLGRLTDVLKVVEANYYRRALPPYETTSAKGLDGHRYILIRKILCCKKPDAEQEFLTWYKDTLMPSVAATPGLVRANLYRLYRVMEELAIDQEERPHYLAVYEIATDPPGRAVGQINRMLTDFRKNGQLSQYYVGGATALYRQLNDVKSKH